MNWSQSYCTIFLVSFPVLTFDQVYNVSIIFFLDSVRIRIPVAVISTGELYRKSSWLSVPGVGNMEHSSCRLELKVAKSLEVSAAFASGELTQFYFHIIFTLL